MVSGASNFLIVLAVARVAGVEEFGAFSLAFLLYQLALGLMRAGAGDVLLIRSAGAERDSGQDPQRALGFVLAFSIPVAVAAGVAGALAGGDLGESLIVIAVVLCPLLLEDCYRYVFFAASRARDAIVIDSVWLLAQLVGFGCAAVGVFPKTPTALVLAWGGGAALACGCAAVLAGVLPSLDILAWVRVVRRRGAGLMADFMLLTGVWYVGFALVPLVASLATVAALRGAQFLFNPFLAFLASLRVVALPVLTRRLSEGSLSYRRITLRMSAALSAVALVYASIVLLLPDRVGVQLLGNSWYSVSAILLPVSLAYLPRAISYPATEGLRVLGSPRRLLATRGVSATVTAACLVGGAAVAGASGGAIAMCVAAWCFTVLWQFSLRAALAQHGDQRAQVARLSEDDVVEEELTVLDGGSLP